MFLEIIGLFGKSIDYSEKIFESLVLDLFPEEDLLYKSSETIVGINVIIFNSFEV